MNKTIYHYTNITGLIGIFSGTNNKAGKISIRASSSDYMNDPTERVHCVKVLAELFKMIEAQCKYPYALYPFFEQITKNDNEKILRWINQHVNILNHNLIACFSENRDTLPMWSRYADDGNGIAIGFDREKLENSIDNSIILNEIVYTNGDIFPTNTVDLMTTVYKKQYPEIDWNTKESIYDMMHGAINYFGSIFKNPAYSYEKEVRLVKSISKIQDQIQFREARGLIVPYIDIEIDSDCVSEIIVGPTKNFTTSKRSIKEYIFRTGRMCGCDSIIVGSDIPYR